MLAQECQMRISTLCSAAFLIHWSILEDSPAVPVSPPGRDRHDLRKKQHEDSWLEP